MRFGIRVDVDLTNISGTLTSEYAGIPIELALPYKLDEYLQGRENMPALRDYILEKGFTCNAVHAVQGRPANENFMSWAPENVRFAEEIGASIVVFHPDRAAKTERLDKQIIVIQNIRSLQRNTKVTVAIEAFGDPKKVPQPEEMVEKKLPMVLDTSHLDQERTMEIIEKHSESITSLHLSELRFDEYENTINQHMPVKDFGFKVLDALKSKKWSGLVTLEYMPWYNDRLLPDREMLEKRYA